MLHARQLRIDFDGVTALDVEELALRRGRITVVLGSNGSGKSTLLRALAGLVEGPRSSVELEQDGRWTPLSTGQVAYAFQRPVLLRGTVRRNLELALELRAVPVADWARRLDAVVAALGIGPLLDRFSHTLSGGEAQRVNLARAIALEGAVTLLDEPLSALDGSTRVQLSARMPDLVRSAMERGVVVLVTHSLEEAQKLADDLLLLVAGRVRASGSLAEVVAAPADEESAQLLGFTVHRDGDETYAVPQGGWTVVSEPSPTEPTAELDVRRVVELRRGTRILGEVSGSWVELTLPRGEEAPTVGARLAVTTAVDARVALPRK